MSEHATDFEQLISDAGIPTTEESLKTEWETIADGENLDIQNDSKYSPFWRVVTAIFTKPVLWLIQLMSGHVLPNAFVKTASGVFLDILAWGVDLVRKLAAKVQGNLTFNRSDTAGTLAIPVGTVVQSAEINGKVYSLVTTEEGTFGDGVASIDVAAEALETGAAYNLSGGYYTVMPEPVAGVDSVTNASDWITSPGADTEKDEELRLRCKNQFTALNQYHTDAVYLAMITSFDNVNVGNVYFEHDAPRGPGTANCYVMFDIGNPSAAFLAPIEQFIMDQGNHGHGDDLQLFPMPETQHDLVATIYPVSNLSAQQQTDLQTGVEQFVRAAFRENGDYTPTLTNPFSRFSFSRLSQELHEAFPNLADVEFNLSSIQSELEIPRLNSLTVTLQ